MPALSMRERFKSFEHIYKTGGRNLKQACKEIHTSPQELFDSLPATYKFALLNLRLETQKSLDTVCREFGIDRNEVLQMAAEAGYIWENGMFKKKNPLTPGGLLAICDSQDREYFTDEEIIQACLLMNPKQRKQLIKDGKDRYTSLFREPQGPTEYAVYDSCREEPVEINQYYESGYKYRKGSRRDLNHYAGCLLGGAVGDALGYPVEFSSWPQIERAYGADGIKDLVISNKGKALISDDTQMTLFTAEGLLRAVTRGMYRGLSHPPGVIYYAYLRWLYTQGELESKKEDCWFLDGWLVTLPELKAIRAPGTTCISALRSGAMRTIDEPINNSKGCGGVMRAAPVGLLTKFEDPFMLACEAAAITHGHPSGYLAAGVLAQIIRYIIDGYSLMASIKKALARLKKHRNHQECLMAVEKALELYERGDFSVSAVESLGGGWVAEEALAISVFCSLAAGDDFAAGVRMAVNHSGDSDSTGAITGNILGALLGYQAIPRDWAEKVELSKEIIELANDLLVEFSFDSWWKDKYPGA